MRTRTRSIYLAQFIASAGVMGFFTPSAPRAQENSDDVGAVEAGKFADLIAVQGDPIEDIAVLQHIKFVMKGGTVIKNELSDAH
jgi:imidazolonepropionase-like amidohydrolase